MVQYRRSKQFWGAAIAISCIIAPNGAVAAREAEITADDPHLKMFQELGERYNCSMESEPPLTREEFAIDFNNCLDSLRTRQLMQCILMPIVSSEDAVLFEELDAEFASELEELGATDDRLEFLYPFEVVPETSEE